MNLPPSLDALSALHANARANYVKNFLLGETFANIRWPSLRFRLCERLHIYSKMGDWDCPQWYVEWSNGRRSSIPEDSVIALYRPVGEMEQAA